MEEYTKLILIFAIVIPVLIAVVVLSCHISNVYKGMMLKRCNKMFNNIYDNKNMMYNDEYSDDEIYNRT